MEATLTSAQLSMKYASARVHGPYAIATRTTGQYTLSPTANAATIHAAVAKIEAEKPKVQREPRQQWGFPIPMPKRAPAYIGPSLTERTRPRTWWDAETRQYHTKTCLATETLSGEPWATAEKRMAEVAEAIGWNTRDGLVPGDYIPRDMAEVKALQRAGLRHAS